MKKILTLILCTALFMSSTACSSDTNSTSDNIEQEKEILQNNTNTVVMGQVTEIYGNKLTLQLAEMGKNGQGFAGGFAAGQKPDGVTGENMPENMPNRENSEFTKPSGENAEQGQRPDGMNRENMPEGASGKMNGGQGMSGGMSSDIDLSDSITLTDEVKEYSIPVDTPVTQFGTEMTFSQITAEMYITLTVNENGNIVAVSILG